MDKQKINQQLLDILDNAVQPLSDIVSGLEKAQNRLESQNVTLSSNAEKLKDEILILKKEKDNFKLFESLNNRLVRNIDKYKTEILSLHKQVERVKQEKYKTIFDLDDIIKEKKQEQEQLFQRVIPDIKDIKRRVRELDILETDLKIIEKRYKKLYTAKGAGFKV